MQSFQNKVCVITGAGSGIGRCLSQQLASRGAKLAISDVNEEALAETLGLLDLPDDRVLASPLDVSDKAAIYCHADEVKKAFAKADVVINNAGVSVADSVEHTSDEDFEWLMNINFWGVVHGSRAFLPLLKKSPEAALVNISSVFGLIGFPCQGAYNASKFAVRGFTEAMRLELKDTSVTPISVHPGGIKTNIAKNTRFHNMMFAGNSREDLLAMFEKNTHTTAAQAAKVIIKGIEKNKKRILIGPDARLYDAMARVMPGSYEKLLGALLNKFMA